MGEVPRELEGGRAVALRQGVEVESPLRSARGGQGEGRVVAEDIGAVPFNFIFRNLQQPFGQLLDLGSGL